MCGGFVSGTDIQESVQHLRSIPNVNKSAEGWFREVLRRAGAPSYDDAHTVLFPSGPRGRPRRPDVEGLFIAWQSARLMERLTQDEAITVLENRWGVPIPKRWLSRKRAALLDLREAIARAGWTASTYVGDEGWHPIHPYQPLDDVAPIDPVARNRRIADWKQHKRAQDAIVERLGALNIGRGQLRGQERMEALEHAADVDTAIQEALDQWSERTIGNREDLLVEAIAAYERRLTSNA